MLSCQQVTRLVSASCERPLTLMEQIALKMHLLICSACRNFSSHIRFLQDAMRAYICSDERQDKQ